MSSHSPTKHARKKFRSYSPIGWVPCPETSFCGLRRWWQVKEQYDNVNYRRHCHNLAQLVGALVEPYFREGYTIYLLGLGISPSCGVRMTQSDPNFGGKPYAVPEQASVVHGAGVWIEELVAELEHRKIVHRRLDVAPVLLYYAPRLPVGIVYPNNKAAALEELREFLDGR